MLINQFPVQQMQQIAGLVKDPVAPDWMPDLSPKGAIAGKGSNKWYDEDESMKRVAQLMSPS